MAAAATKSTLCSVSSDLVTDALHFFDQSVRTDHWGQIVEATDSYQRTERVVEEMMQIQGVELPEQAFFTKLKKCLELRRRRLTSEVEGPTVGPSMEEIVALRPMLARYATNESMEESLDFPVDLSQWGESNDTLGLPSEEEIRMAIQERAERREEPESNSAAAAMQPPKREEDAELTPCELLERHLANLPDNREPGDQFLVLDIHKIGLKDAEDYQEPMITVSVGDGDGNLMEPQLNTDIANKKERRHVCFNNRVYIQTPIDTLVDKECAIFFEFKHYKRKKKYVSVRCWSFMEMDEVPRNGGPLALEMYVIPSLRV